MTAQAFELGKFFGTPGAYDSIGQEGILFAILKHAACDWSEMDPHDQRENKYALENGGRIFSAYTIDDQKVWVITEADRSVTTVLLPSEY